MTNLLEVTDLTKEYGHFSLDKLTFQLPEGFILGMIGPNGAGKTTTLRMILDMATPTSGQIKLDGQTSRQTRLADRDQVGIVLDNTVFPDGWKADKIARTLAMVYQNWDGDRFFDLLKEFDVDRQVKYKSLSRGSQVKLNLAAAIAHQPKLLILDEPAAGLDPIARDQLITLLQGFIADGHHSVLLSSHITDDLAKIADYLVYLIHGQQLFFGETQTLLDRYAVVKGGLDQLTGVIKQAGIGLRTYETGFSVLMARKQLSALPRDLVIEPVSLDELMVYFGKRVAKDEARA
ncbi:ABC transporter ATP-binding protein [Lentilactobacillus raoultii]|uniref:ABC transporter ATP-binding protein n=1 Tax=Lentilactobacillus raoultii TaxID=1987503 RepID=A0ABW3PGS1_9LACO|nr:ABC transporter ATP-binding protein [Lentilactobacillus raoultii]